MANWPTAVGLVTGYLADQALGDPRRWHPVAGFGRGAAALERRVWRDHRAAGAAHWVGCVAPVVLVAAVAERSVQHRPLARAVATGVATWVVLGGAGLAREGTVMAGLLEETGQEGDLAAARRRLSHLCGRDPAGLGPDEIARAAVESVAENTSDAVVAPLLWGAFAGLPGLLGYRVVNTLDAMVGHRTPRYRRFGWFAARADDVANLVPARVAALLAVVAAPAVGGSRAAAAEVWRRDAAGHPSPNAGPVEAAFAGALGVRLGGLNVYDGEPDDRGTLGDGGVPSAADLPRAVRLSRVVGGASLVLSVGVVAAGVVAARARRRRG